MFFQWWFHRWDRTSRLRTSLGSRPAGAEPGKSLLYTHDASSVVDPPLFHISWDEAITLMNEGYMLYPPVALQLKPPPG